MRMFPSGNIAFIGGREDLDGRYPGHIKQDEIQRGLRRPRINELGPRAVAFPPDPSFGPQSLPSAPLLLLFPFSLTMKTQVNAIFWGMQTAGLLGAFVMLLTATIWHNIARRHSSWFNFMITWLLSCASYLFTMNTPANRQPDHALCLFQAALIYSVPTLTSGATVALVVNVYLNLRSLLTGSRNHNRTVVSTALIVAPYIPAWAVFASALTLGLSEPSRVQRLDGAAYCTITSLVPSRVSAALVATLMTACLALEIIIIRAMRRAWETLRRDDRGSIPIIVRVFAFTLVGMLSIILSLVLLALPSTSSHDAAFNIVIATIPISSVIIFGTQKDILTAWCSILNFNIPMWWRRRTDAAADDEVDNVTESKTDWDSKSRSELDSPPPSRHHSQQLQALNVPTLNLPSEARTSRIHYEVSVSRFAR
ncbi:hypothetical protein MKEN_00616500 [Mycena kentingensis (nom. inval.)]|nr:hypothetical protein MKEN_00616500 [Mycena kentingensis (nom. inval.)]